MSDESNEVTGVQRWMALDLWAALGLDPAAFDGYIDRNGFGATWATLGARVRDLARGTPPCNLHAWCVRRDSHLGPCLDDGDVGSGEPLPLIDPRRDS